MTRFSTRVLKLASASALTMTVAGTAHASAFYLQEQSVRGAGRRFRAKAPTWARHPCGGTRRRSAASPAATWPSASARSCRARGSRIGNDHHPSRPGASSGRRRSGRSQPHRQRHRTFGRSFVRVRRVAVGLAITSPFSFGTDYDASELGALHCGKDQASHHRSAADRGLRRFAQPDDRRRPQRRTCTASLSNYLPNLAPGLPDGFQRLKGKGWDWGWSVGGQYRSGPLSFGLSYKSSIKHNLDGSVTTSGLLGPIAPLNGSVDTQASFRTPWQAIASVRFRATDRFSSTVRSCGSAGQSSMQSA